jgi:hypothetical protein
MAVSSINVNNQFEFSCQGPEIDLTAPGISIYSATTPGNQYGTWSGTSFATPHVSGTAALVWSQAPGLSRDQVRNILTSTADDLGPPGFDNQYGWGRVDAEGAVLSARGTHSEAVAYFGNSVIEVLVDVALLGGVRDTGISDTNHADGHQLVVYSYNSVVEWSVWSGLDYTSGWINPSSTTTIAVSHQKSFVVTIYRTTRTAWLFCRESGDPLVCDVQRDAVTASLGDTIQQLLIDVPGLGGVRDTGVPDTNHADGHQLQVYRSTLNGDQVEWSVWHIGTYLAGSLTSPQTTTNIDVPHYKSFIVTIWRHIRTGWIFCRENDGSLTCSTIRYGTYANLDDISLTDVRDMSPNVGEIIDWDDNDGHGNGHLIDMYASGSWPLEWSRWQQDTYVQGATSPGGAVLLTIPHQTSFILTMSRPTHAEIGWIFCRENDYLLYCSFL